MPKPSLAQWRVAIDGAAREIATCALSFRGAEVLDPVGADRAVQMIGAHLPVLGGGRAFDLSLVSSPDGCRAMARAMLCLDANATLRDTEMADAIGEMVNMLGGTLKRRLSSQLGDMVLGLPIFVHGYIQPTERLSIIALPTRFGEIDTIVLITGQGD
jgi:hypothetical protein